MQEKMIFEPNFTKLGKNIPIIVFLGIIIIILIPIMSSPTSALNDKMLSHKMITKINAFFAYQRLKVLGATDQLFRVSISYMKDIDEARNDYAAKPRKLLHRTFRIPEDVIKALENETNFERVPLSNLVNKILRNYLVTQLRSEKTGFILVSKDFFRGVFDKIDEKSIGDYGKDLGYTVVSEYMSSYFPEINSHTLIQFLKSWFKRFQSYQHRIDEQNFRHTFSLNHDINMNFSIALKAILEGLIEPVTKSTVIFGELTSSSITFTFEV
jgi:hypothetical protein